MLLLHCILSLQPRLSSISSSIGAVALLLDVSCDYGSRFFDTYTDFVYGRVPSNSTELLKLNTKKPVVLGLHTFIQTPTGLAPKFDFSGFSQTDPNAFVVAAKAGVSLIALCSLVLDARILIYEYYRISPRPLILRRMWIGSS